jgi:hypothetical protein
MSYFNKYFNPFRGLSVEELIESYLYFHIVEDKEAVSLVADAYDEDIYIDLRDFGIATTDYP